MKNAYQKTKEIQEKLTRNGFPFDTDFYAVERLRRAERQLHRWCELEYGMTSNWKIE